MRRLVLATLGLVVVCSSAEASQRALVSWSGSTDTNVVAYDIYYGDASGHYTNVISVGNVTNTTVSGLCDGATYYFAAKARSASGLESAFSSEFAYSVPGPSPRITQCAPVTGGFSFSVGGVSNYNYVVEASTNMVDWVALQTNLSPFAFVDTNASRFSRRFYRAVYFP